MQNITVPNETEKEMINSVIDDFSDLVMESYYNKKLYINDLKNIIVLAAEVLDIEICDVKND